MLNIVADVCGFFFREAPHYKPPRELYDFLSQGPPPIYIRFGSIIVDDAERLTATLLQAIEVAGVRAIISRGWSQLGGTEGRENIFFLDDCPHGKTEDLYMLTCIN